MRPTSAPPLDISEKGANGQSSDECLYMQLQVFSDITDPQDAVNTLHGSGLNGVLYVDANDPHSVALLSWSTQAEDFIHKVQPVLRRAPFATAKKRYRNDFIGRTYSIGYEPSLQEVLCDRPIRYALDEDTPWAVWYPLRRKGEFARLAREEQLSILKEHGEIGFRFGAAGMGRDIRLACHGMGGEDNDFVIGLLGKNLRGLSKLVEAMRPTVQTSAYLESIGPFFVGYALWRHG